MKKKIYLCLLSAILLIASFPKPSLWPVAFFALIPMLLAIKKEKPVKAFLLGTFTGTVAYCGILYWLVTTFSAAGEPKIIGFTVLLLLSSYLAIYYGLFCLFSSLFTLRSSLFLAFFWVSLEFLRTHLFTGFPWAVLGYTQWNNLPLIQISEFTGVYGISFLIVLVNLTISKTIIEKNKTLSLYHFITLSLILISLIFGFYTLKQPPTANCQPPTISILQGNIDQYKKWDNNFEMSVKNTYAELAKKTSQANPPPALIVWPETSVPGFLRNDKELYNWMINITEETKTQHLVGTVDYADGRTYNSAFLFSASGGITGGYSKVHLVPFGEYMPLKKFVGKFIKVANEIGETTPGKNYTVINSSAGKIGVNICFEAIFPDEVRKSVKNGAETIVNITNDAWYLKTSAPYQHFTMNVLRAIENRREVIRAANTGISGFIDPLGRITSRTKIYETCELSDFISKNRHLTFYTLYGDLFCYLCLFFSIIALTIAKK